ncbi:MAG: sulfite exporter TauE/SafE family protein [Sphaerochaeta sp.]|jgi:hypothetical protein|uniref:sulfite exporter TauE/SafE family protein n=1 Tax=Sphaerochaeta sp. TaxID=1972642 RepID=UPI002FCA944C
MLFIQVFAIALLGAFLQANIGFGFPVIAMVFLPSLFPFSTAVALNQMIALASTGYLTLKYRASIRYATLIPLLISSLVVGMVFILFSFSLDSRILVLLLGGFLILLSLYFIIFSARISIKPTRRNSLAMGSLAGLGNGLFGIGGPPVALYLLASTGDKRAYLGTIQAYFLICNIQSIILRSMHGAVALDQVPLVLLGWAGIGMGTYLGLKLFNIWSETVLKRIVYGFVGISGVWIIINAR